MRNNGSEYAKHQDGGTTVFEVTPARAPKFTYLLIVGGVVALLGLGTLAAGFGVFFLAMAAFCFWYGWFRDMRPEAHRKHTSFRVRPDVIEAGGRTFKKEDIHRLILKNGITDQDLSGVEIHTSNANVAAGMSQRARVAQVANSLNVETGGKSFLLAGGMDETTAYGLLHDVSTILGHKIA